MNPDLAAFLAAWEEEIVFGQVLARRASCGFALRHVADREAAEETLRLVQVGELRQLAQYTAEGVFRPLKSASNLRRGWRARPADGPTLALCLHHLYPGALADWFAAHPGTPPVTSYREFTARQTGMYRITATLADPVAAAVTVACCHPASCLKRRLWSVGELATDPPGDKSIIPCLEPCAILLEFARKAGRWEQERAAKPPPAPEESRQLTEEAIERLKHPQSGAQECEFDSADNPRRLRFVLERNKVALARGLC
jgi:hypothetical protein